MQIVYIEATSEMWNAQSPHSLKIISLFLNKDETRIMFTDKKTEIPANLHEQDCFLFPSASSTYLFLETLK